MVGFFPNWISGNPLAAWEESSAFYPGWLANPISAWPWEAVECAFVLVVAGATHAHVADNLALTQAHALAVQESTHAHAADNLALTQAHALAVQESTHAHAADNLALTQAHALAVQESTHAHTADVLTLVKMVTPWGRIFMVPAESRVFPVSKRLNVFSIE